MTTTHPPLRRAARWATALLLTSGAAVAVVGMQPAAGALDVRIIQQPIVLSAGEDLRGVELRAGAEFPDGADMLITANPNGHNPGIDLEDVVLDCNGIAGRGAFLRGADDLRASRVEVRECTAPPGLSGAFQVRGFGGNDPTHNPHLEDVWAHHNRGNGIHIGFGVRGTMYERIVAEFNGGSGLVVDGSESVLSGVRARGNGDAGVELRNLIATQASGLQLTGNRHGLRALSLVGARVELLAQNNREIDVFFDPTLISPPGGEPCVGGPGCPSNYGRTRDVIVSGVAGPADRDYGTFGKDGAQPFVSAPGQTIDREDLIITDGIQ